jgi:Spy/CpxP family protein refolding chaperone
MTTRHKQLAALLALCTMLGTEAMAKPAAAQSAEDDAWEAPACMIQRPEALLQLIDQLGVDAKTSAKLTEIVGQAQEKQIGLSADLARASLELHRALDADKPNRAAIKEMLAKVGRLRAALHELRVTLRLDVEQTLSPTQRARLRELARGMGSRMGAARRMGGNGPKTRAGPKRGRGAPRGRNP